MVMKIVPSTDTDRLLQAGKHLAVKLAEVYKAHGLDPLACQAIRDWLIAIKPYAEKK